MAACVRWIDCNGPSIEGFDTEWNKGFCTRPRPRNLAEALWDVKMKIVKRKKKPMLGGDGKRGQEADHWLMFEKGELRGGSQHPEWLELYLLLWFYQHTQRHGSRQVSPEVVLEALQVKALSEEAMRRLYREIQTEHASKMVSFQKSWALVRRGALPKNAHFLYLWLHRYADESGMITLSFEELVLRVRLPAQVVSYALAVLERMRLIERKGPSSEPTETEALLGSEAEDAVLLERDIVEGATVADRVERVRSDEMGEWVFALAKSRIPWC